MAAFYDFEAKDINGQVVSMKDYKDKVVLIVNVASACGLTPQYDGLQALYKQHSPDQFVVLGFPCNQFGAQEPGSEAEIQTFCQTKFNVTFPIFSKIEVNGEHAHPLYKFLKEKKAGAEGGDIEWNFAKFLLNRNGEVVERFSPKVPPEDLASAIVSLLA